MRYLVIALTLFLASCGVSSPQSQQAAQERAFATINAGLNQGAAPLVRNVTINGRDPSGAVIDPINVWKNYTDRSAGVVAQLHDGDQVTMLRRVGQGVEVQTAEGVKGWVTFTFIKELQ